MKKIKIISAISAIIMTMSIGVCANAFSDMPGGEMGAALQNAVDAGLINGITDDTIAPYDNITRAQMATIITRAFGAVTKSGDIFPDVKDGAWYKDAVLKAAAMGAFEGDDNNNFNPENNITFQETYLVLSRVFGFDAYEARNKSIIGDCDIAVLDSFSDKDEIAQWAVNGAKYIVGNGGWTGIDGKLYPTKYITRGEFAILMDALVGVYIDEPGEYKNLGDELIMVRSGGVTIDGLKSNHNLIVTYAVDQRGFGITNSIVNGVTLILGGEDTTPQTLTDAAGKIRTLPDDSHVFAHGKFYDVRVKAPYIYANLSQAIVEYYYGVSGTRVALSANH